MADRVNFFKGIGILILSIITMLLGLNILITLRKIYQILFGLPIFSSVSNLINREFFSLFGIAIIGSIILFIISAILLAFGIKYALKYRKIN